MSKAMLQRTQICWKAFQGTKSDSWRKYELGSTDRDLIEGKHIPGKGCRIIEVLQWGILNRGNQPELKDRKNEPGFLPPWLEEYTWIFTLYICYAVTLEKQ